MTRWPSEKFSKSFLLKRYLPVVVLVFAALLAISIILFPSEAARHDHYSIFHDPISSLGHYDVTPGWIPFSIALVWLGIGAIPLMPYAYARLNPICAKTAALGAFFAILGCLGIIGVGLFPDVHDPILGSSVEFVDVHNITAGLGYGGWFLAFVIWWFPMYKDNVSRWGGTKQVPLKPLLVGSIALMSLMLGTGISQLYVSLAGMDSFEAGFLSWPFWEWVMTCALLGYMVGLIYILPARFEIGKEKS